MPEPMSNACTSSPRSVIPRTYAIRPLRSRSFRIPRAVPARGATIPERDLISVGKLADWEETQAGTGRSDAWHIGCAMRLCASAE